MPDTQVFKPRKPREFPVAIVVILALVIVAGGGAWYLSWRWSHQPPPAAVLTSEGKAYVRNLQLSEVDMKAHESYLNQQVVEIVGKITNNGDRALQLVELNCVFYDPYGQMVLRERVPIVKPRTGGLKPGETKTFRLPFDSIPPSWNQTLPQLVIAQVVFG